MVDEVALVEHLKQNPMFRVGLDVFEVNKTHILCRILFLLQTPSLTFIGSPMVLYQDEPYMKPGLADLKNAIVVPHIASASKVI